MSPAIIILAGRRSGVADPLARAAGVSHKCIAPVAGEPMIVHVVRTISTAFPESRVLISIDDPKVIDSVPEIAGRIRNGCMSIINASSNIVDSIATAVRSASLPAIVTTADNVLLSADALKRIAAYGPSVDADAVIALTQRESVLMAHEDGQRRFYEFHRGAFSNCNLYWLGNARALKAAEAFRGGGQFVKHPARIVVAFGILNLIRFRFRMNSIEGLCRHVGKRFGVSLKPLILADGRQSIDVDNERTLRVAEELLARGAA